MNVSNNLRLPISLDDVLHGKAVEWERLEVRISPEDLVVLSFPGPDRSIRMADLRVSGSYHDIGH